MDLTDAARDGNLELVQEFVKNGASLTVGDNFALRWAARNGHLETVKYLIENGADVAAEDNGALRMAAFNGHFGVVKYLVENGADLFARDSWAFRWATENGHIEIAKYLKAKSNPLRQNKLEIMDALGLVFEKLGELKSDGIAVSMIPSNSRGVKKTVATFDNHPDKLKPNWWFSVTLQTTIKKQVAKIQAVDNELDTLGITFDKEVGLDWVKWELDWTFKTKEIEKF
jgi:ankyrin repeat protein